MKKVILFAGALSILITQTGCFGSFGLVQKIYEFNDGISQSKVLKTLLFYVLIALPVYSIAGFLDIVIFNLIEFWSGSNPLVMEEGQYEEQLMTIKGESYKVKATKNKMEFAKLVDGEMVDMGEMVFNPKDNSWSFVKDGEAQKLAAFDIRSNTVDYFSGDAVTTVDASTVEYLATQEINCNTEVFAAK